LTNGFLRLGANKRGYVTKALRGVDSDQLTAFVGVTQAGPLVTGLDKAPDRTCITLQGIRSNGCFQFESPFRAEFNTGTATAALVIYNGFAVPHSNGAQRAISGANPATGAFFCID
jgi:hypothetical protein